MNTIIKRINGIYIRNKLKSIFYTFVLICLPTIYILSREFSSLKFFILIPLAILLGIGFTALFKNIFTIKNVFTHLICSLFLGLFLNTLLIFLIGSVGVELNKSFYIVYILSSLLLNAIIFFIHTSEDEISSYLRNTRFNWWDVAWYVILVFFSLLFINICLENFYPNWDSYTHWAIDSKYIYENERLRDQGFDLLRYSYLPFYPLQLSYVYWIYGAVVEQYSSLVTLTYLFIGTFFCYSQILNIREKPLTKSLLYLLALSPLYTFFLIQGLPFTQYADIFCSVVILFYGIVLFGKKPDLKSYGSRFLLIFLFSFALYLTKTNYLAVTAFLLAFYLLFDAKFLIYNFKKLFSSRMFWVASLIIGIVFALVFIYSRNFVPPKENTALGFMLQNLTTIGTDRIKYLFDMIEFFFKEITMFLFMSIIVFVASIISTNGLTRRSLLLVSFVLLLSSIPVTYYFITQGNFVDMSILRYIGLIFFVTCFVLILLPSSIKITSLKQETLFSILLILISVFLFSRIYITNNVDLNFSPHTGSYKDFIWHKEFFMLGERVSQIVPEESSIMIVDQEGELIGNMSMPVIILRYSLSEYSVGHQYRFQPVQWYDYMKEIKPDYILVFTYDNYWPGCNGILEKEHSYLIKVDNLSEEYNDSNCFFETENLIEL